MVMRICRFQQTDSSQHPTMFTISSPTPEEFSEIVKESWDELSGSEPSLSKQNYDKLPQNKKEDLIQLATFLSFHILANISEKIQPEVDVLINSLMEAIALPNLREIDASSISEGIHQLRHLKGGGLVPGNRIPRSNISSYIYENAPVIVRDSNLRSRYRVIEWNNDYSIIVCSTDLVTGAYPLSNLLFFEPQTPNQIKKHKATKGPQFLY